MINRLLSLELQGYKTFASSSTFGFPGQITAIVGPNGSGKSNIADAVRWVLGEQAYSLLRGKRTEDMIFSGSESRPRASMASVSIKFDNEDGWLPVDFTEVVITRRAYRSGENEYLLNNQRVRLKEINELLGNSGLGERNYTIIGQGLIDNALSLKPDERRRFIEEAAGIDLYRSRREEATQKLDKTLRNMERVKDILGELKPRINALSRSREKTVQYKQIQSDLRLMLKEWYGYHWYKSRETIKQARDFYHQQREIFEIAKIDLDEKEKQLNSVQGNLHQNRADLADLHKQVSQLHHETEEITRKIAVYEERENSLKSRIAEIENEIEVNREQKSGLSERISKVESQGKDYQSNLESAIRSFDIAEENLNKKITLRKELEEKNIQIHSLVLSNQSSLLEFNAALSGLEKEIGQKEYEIKEILNFISESKNELMSLEAKKEKAEDYLRDTQDALNKEIESADVIHESLKDVTEEMDSLKATRQEKKNRLSSINAELRVLKEAEGNLEGFSSGSAELISAAKNRKIRGGLTALLNFLEIPEKYEMAITAGLGEVIEGVITDESSNTENLLDYLEKNRIARTSIITGKNTRQNHRPDFNGKVTFADEILKVNSPTGLILKNLLSRMVIVDSRDRALKLFENIQPGWKIVTLSGEVFDGNGIITAGLGSKVQPIRRKREKGQLEKETAHISKEIVQVEKEILKLEENYVLLQDQNEKRNSEKQKIYDLKQTIQLEIQKLDLEITQKSIVFQREEHRKDEIEKDIYILKTRVEKIKSEIAEKNSEISILTPRINEEVISAINLEIESQRKALLDLSSKRAVTEELYKRQSESNALLMNSLERIDQKIVELNEQSILHRKVLTETKDSKTFESQKYSEVMDQIEKITQKITPLEIKVESIIGQQGKIIEDVDEGRKQFAIIERHTLQAQMNFEKLQDQLSFLKTKIEEDFGMLGEEGGDDIADRPLPLDEILISLPTTVQLDDRLENEINQKKSLLRRLGPINPEAEKEYCEVNTRYEFLSTQLLDLEKAESDLRKVVKELDELMETKFIGTYKKVNEEFKEIFGHLFSGGSAKLILGDEQNVLDGGIEIEATLPGKRKQELALLSGGERSLTAVALIFALLRISPTPFCILDEVDAMLDESNVVKFGEMLRELSDTTQFIVITHNRNTVQLADILYGITMGKDSVSQVISLKLDELTEEMVQ